MHVTANSKEVKPGSIFFALKGAKFDGHDFIKGAFAAGASKVYAEHDTGVPGVIVLGDKTRKKLGELASEMYGHPSHRLMMIGITGTSGKTTTSYLIHHLLEENGIPTARLGTNGGFFKGKEVETANTTPDALTLQKWFKEVEDLGAKAVVMEVSSHALDQDRSYGVAWDSACFLNLSPEHLDYHPTLEEYFQAKALLFNLHADFSRGAGKHPKLFSNVDSKEGARLVQENPSVLPWSVSKQVQGLKSTASGIEGTIQIGDQTAPFQCPLFGKFQMENILGAVSVVTSLGVNFKAVCAALSSFAGVPGRMEQIQNAHGLQVFVDYAHKPEALEKVLLAIQPEAGQNYPILTVMGCGGDRDKTKRPVMGEIATRLSEHVYLTSDNPRTEDALQILKEIEGGIRKKNYEVIPDRRAAIQKAIQDAKSGSLILIAGKGHEDYQILGTQKIHFDDREEARDALSRKA